jgi:two-component system chemotaxis sensor kinase CheA
VTLRAYREAGSIVIQLADDGAGLDRERILARARSLALVAEGESLSDREIHRLVLEPGFSTAQEITDLSGRGVGLDVVRRNVERLRGSVGIESREGEGTTITLRLPLTLAIIAGFGVGVGSVRFHFDAAVESPGAAAQVQARGAGRGVPSSRGGPPYLRLRRQIFGVDGAGTDPGAGYGGPPRGARPAVHPLCESQTQ